MNLIGLIGSGMRRALVASLLVSLVMVLGSSLAANAAPTPSTTVTVVCYRGVDVNPGEGPGLSVTLFGASNNVVGGTGFVECPAGGGGTRFRFKIQTPAGDAVTAAYSCWNGFIATNNGSGPLALTAECFDTVPDPDVAFAKVTIR